MSRISSSTRPIARPAASKLEAFKTGWETRLIDGALKRVSTTRLPATAKAQLAQWKKAGETGVAAFGARISGVDTFVLQRDGRDGEKRGSSEVLGVYVMFDKQHRLSIGWSSDSPQIYWS